MLPIHTRRFQLRDFETTDAAEVQAYASDPVVTRYMWWGPNSDEETRAFIQRARQQAVQRPRGDFELAIVHRDTQALIGGCGLMSRRPQYREYEVGYCLNRDWWGQGCGREVVLSITTFGLSKLNAHRIYALVDPENQSSWKLLEKLGYQREGHQRRDTRIDGEWCDTLVYAVLEEEWNPVA